MKIRILCGAAVALAAAAATAASARAGEMLLLLAEDGRRVTLGDPAREDWRASALYAEGRAQESRLSASPQGRLIVSTVDTSEKEPYREWRLLDAFSASAFEQAKPLRRRPAGTALSVAAWSPDGARFFLGDIDGLTIYSAAGGTLGTIDELPRTEDGSGIAIWLKWWGDGTRLLAYSPDFARSIHPAGQPTSLLAVPETGRHPLAKLIEGGTPVENVSSNDMSGHVFGPDARTGWLLVKRNEGPDLHLGTPQQHASALDGKRARETDEDGTIRDVSRRLTPLGFSRDGATVYCFLDEWEEASRPAAHGMGLTSVSARLRRAELYACTRGAPARKVVPYVAWSPFGKPEDQTSAFPRASWSWQPWAAPVVSADGRFLIFHGFPNEDARKEGGTDLRAALAKHDGTAGRFVLVDLERKTARALPEGMAFATFVRVAE